MHANGLFQSGADLSLSWILSLPFGLLLLAVVIGAITSGMKKLPASRTGDEKEQSSKRAVKTISTKKSQKIT